MELQRWNYGDKKYYAFNIPDNWNVKMLTEDMEEMVNCPNCGLLLPFKHTYTSKEIHNSMGFGYWVCGKCYKEELERYFQSAKSAL